MIGASDITEFVVGDDGGQPHSTTNHEGAFASKGTDQVTAVSAINLLMSLLSAIFWRFGDPASQQ